MPTAYDQVPYPCNAYPQTHPGHLAALARLRGLAAPAPETCRYLEIGCGDGGNLLPLASVLPGARFLGMDLAATSIETALHHQRQFGLSNVEFRACDLMELHPAELGSWDYIIAHGFFSWVPEPVRLRLLRLCREMLAPGGVAFISYNAFPGGHIRQMTREMMLYHTETAPDPATKIGQARALMQFLAESRGTDDEYGGLLHAEAGRVRQYTPNHLYHDDLAPLNQPFYLHEFAALAEAHGLSYLGDADYASMHATRYPREVRELLAGLGDDPIRMEQYLDFIKCRRFRQTLLCRDDATLSPPGQIPAGVLESLFYASSANPIEAAPGALLDDSEVRFEGEAGLKLQTRFPLAKTALASLGRVWPARLSWQSLLATVAGSLNQTPEDLRQPLETVISEFLQMGSAEAHLMPAPFVSEAGHRPRASAWALYQQKLGGGITTLRHHTIHIQDAFGSWLLQMLDGSRTREELAQALVERIPPESRQADADADLAEATRHLEMALAQFARLGLLTN